MTDRNDHPLHPAASSSQLSPVQIHILHLKSVALTLPHGYPVDVEPETDAGVEKLLAVKSLDAPATFKARRRPGEKRL
jgi:hypothetical protein